jgi:hypothetical protein
MAQKGLTAPDLVPRLRMSGSIPPLSFCAFMLWTGKTLPLSAL